MSQPKLTLRPPPNVDFVHGYPGIPPGQDRQQAAVKGAIEVRVGPQGVKAKWVRIELRKVETLPGGGIANTFFDFVGQSPINLWQSPNDEYSTLHANDFPFFIRIPESIPPTIALEKGAGIKYELIASVCVQGKKGFLRRDKPITTATVSTIIVDKHELHSTWPIYSQPETRTHTQDGVTLVVERAHTCYGPGDRVVVMATVKSDTLHTVILRGFEFMLRETTIFRAAPHTQGKKGNPQVKVSSIGEQKVPVNATLYGGTQHKAELNVTVPSHHTSATINAARHIDINYVLTVKALMGTGQPLIMDLPIMISNWPRAVSVEAMRRIGHAFNVSLPNQPHAQPPSQSPTTAQQNRFSPTSATKPSHGYSNSLDQKPPLVSPPVKTQFSTAPPLSTDKSRYGQPDEFGVPKQSIDLPTQTQTIGATGYNSTTTTSTARPRAPSAASSHENGAAPSGIGARPRSSGGRGAGTQRLTIVNASEEEMREQMEAEAERARRHPPSTILESPVALGTSQPLPQASPTLSQKTSGSGAGQQQWLSAEKEKELLYQRAVAGVQRVQGRGPPDSSASQNGHADTASIKSPAPTSTPVSSSSKHNKWMSAEEEKRQLYESAQAAVARAHASVGSPMAGGSSSSGAGGSSRVPSMSAGAALYSEAMSAISKPLSPQPISSPTPSVVSPTPVRQSTASALPSASDEKAMLARYFEAKNAVWHTQSAHYGPVPGNATEPVPYDALYPGQQPKSSSPAPSQSPRQPQTPVPPSTPPAGAPPTFAMAAGSSAPHPAVSEKEQMRRYYEAQDAAAQQQQQFQQRQQSWQPAPPPAEDYASSPPPGPYPPPVDPRFSGAPAANVPPAFAMSPGPTTPLSAFAEKEMLRRRYEQEDAAGSPGTRPTPTPPSRTSQLMNGRGRPPPTPPISPNVAPGTPVSARPLTAAEEKARLRAMYEAEDRGGTPPRPAYGGTPPPPLAPAGVPGQLQVQSAYPSPPPSNGFHATPPPPPPLAPKPPREYIEETRAEDARTTAKLSAIDATGAVPDAEDEDLEEADADAEVDVDEMDAKDSTFGPGTLSAFSSKPSSPGPGAGPSRQNTMTVSRSSTMSAGPGTPLGVPPPPPLPPKVLIE